MSNHLHLLIERQVDSIGRIMHPGLTGYSSACERTAHTDWAPGGREHEAAIRWQGIPGDRTAYDGKGKTPISALEGDT